MTDTDGNLRINIRSPAYKQGAGNTDNLRKAVEQRLLHNETFDEAWTRILAMKNSAKDERRLMAVKQAMEEGRIGRDPDRASRRFSKAEVKDLYAILEEQARLGRLQELRDNKPDNYVMITDEEGLAEVVDTLRKESVIVFDVETTGVDVHSDIVVGHVLSATEKDVHYYIPTDHKEASPQLDREYVANILRPIYEDASKGFIAHNAKFDLQMLYNNFGINVANLMWDTQEAMRLLNENEPSYALKTLATKYLRDNSYTYGDLFGQIGFDEVDLETALAYAAKDGDLTYRLYQFQRHHLAKHGNILEYFETIEMPMIPLVSKIELRGYDIDTERAEEYAAEIRKEIDELQKELRREFGDINMNSPAQLKEAIEASIGRQIPNTNANKTLKPLSKDYKILRTLLEYRSLSKTLGTYVEAIPQLIKKQTGRVHTELRPNGTVTGRFSSGEDSETSVTRGLINIQNQSPESRTLYVAPEGYYIVNADFSAQEVRIIASLSQEDVLINAFAEGVDAYATLASEFFNKPYDECYKLPDGSDTEYRKQMKVVLLSSMYGASKYGLSDSLGIRVEEAEEFRLSFFDKYRKIDGFIKDTQAFAKRNGFVWIGDKSRKRRLPEARSKREFIPQGKWNDPKYENAKRKNRAISQAMRQGPNARVQGLAAMQTKKTMLALDELVERKGWEWFAPIHDEIVLYVTDDINEDDFAEIDRVMTQTYLLDGVDNATDIEVQRRWGVSITAEEFLKDVEVPKL